MAQVVGKYAANKLLGKHMQQYANKKVEQGDVSTRTPLNGRRSTC